MIEIIRKNDEFRVKWVEQKLKTIPKGSRILDAGAGELDYKKYCKHLEYVSQDFGKYDGKGNNMGFQTKKWDNSKIDIVSDITHIPVSDKSFDAVLCVEVFEHIPDPKSAVIEFSRIIKKGGSLILTAPFCSLTHFAPYHFYTGFNRYFYETVLKENGFKIKEITANGDYFEYLSQEICRLRFMINKYTTLPYWVMSFFILPLQLMMVILLKIMTTRNKSSEELLCFGYQVLAIKSK